MSGTIAFAVTAVEGKRDRSREDDRGKQGRAERRIYIYIYKGAREEGTGERVCESERANKHSQTARLSLREQREQTDGGQTDRETHSQRHRRENRQTNR